MDPATLLGSGGLLALQLATIATALVAIYLTVKILWRQHPRSIRFQVLGVHRRLAGAGASPDLRVRRPKQPGRR